MTVLPTLPWRTVCACALMLGAVATAAGAGEREVVPLWTEGAPGGPAAGAENAPTLTVCLPDTPSGAGIVVCPGGGYGGLALDHEGDQVAAWLNENGVAAFILRYRHRGTGFGHPAPLQDAQRAIRTVRTRVKAWNVEPDRIGILGFSAGGHLASSAGTHFDAGRPDADDPVERVSCRPDFMVLIYPVISFTEPFSHSGSRKNLLGTQPAEDLVELFSNEKQVTRQTPPTFLVHTTEDSGVPPENSIAFYAALRKAKVPAEMHIFEKGPHGFGLGQKVGAAGNWPRLCIEWMRGRGLLGPADRPQ